MKKLSLILLIVSGAVLLYDSQVETPVSSEGIVSGVTQSEAPVKTSRPEVGKPLTLTIPTLSIVADIEYVGATEEGDMDVPKEDENVAWWQHGPKPGELGSSVLAGHLDTSTGAPAVFYELDSLTPGDEVLVEDENGYDLTFKVVDKKLYKDATFPIATVFDQNDAKRLNLITCAGTYIGSRGYTDRLVIFTKLVE